MSKIMLFSLFLFSVASSGVSAAEAEKPAMPEISGVNSYLIPFDSPTDFDHIQVNTSPGADRVCLNIHAFIFKTYDDRVPQLVGETTCMPASGAAAKKVKRNVQPKLVPVDGGHSF